MKKMLMRKELDRMGYSFLDEQGTFSLDMPENYSYQYFPTAGEQGIKSVLTPNFGGDSKRNQNEFLLEPVSVENLHNNRSTRNFWCRIEGVGSWSVTGASAGAEQDKFTARQDVSKMTAGFMWMSVTRRLAKCQIDAKVDSFVPVEHDVEIMRVTLTNCGQEEVTLTPVVAVPIYGRSADNIRDHRHVTSLLHRIRTREEGVVVRPTLSFDERGHRINEVNYFVCGVTGDGKAPEAFFPTVEDLIGEGGSFTAPRAVLADHLLNEQITEEEINTMQSEYESEFALHAYYVYALRVQERQTDKEQYIYLHNVEGYDVFLVSDKNAELLLKNELAQEYIGCSLLHTGIRELRTAYQEAVDARQQAFCANKTILHAGGSSKNIPEEFEEQGKKLAGREAAMQRVQLLGTDKSEELVKAWNGLFHAVKHEWLTPAALDRCMADFWQEIRKTYRNILMDEEENMQRLSEHYSYPMLAVWQTEFMEWMLGLHDRINSQYDTNRNQQKIKQAIDFIHKNYDKDLNMAVVSNYISMNYSLFSYLFKEYTGNNFVNYLKSIRMEEAKKLLAGTELRIVEISARVGYENEKHFMKTFKASCGVSPSEYRKNIQMQNFPLGGG